MEKILEEPKLLRARRSVKPKTRRRFQKLERFATLGLKAARNFRPNGQSSQPRNRKRKGCSAGKCSGTGKPELPESLRMQKDFRLEHEAGNSELRCFPSLDTYFSRATSPRGCGNSRKYSLPRGDRSPLRAFLGTPFPESPAVSGLGSAGGNGPLNSGA